MIVRCIYCNQCMTEEEARLHDCPEGNQKTAKVIGKSLRYWASLIALMLFIGAALCYGQSHDPSAVLVVANDDTRPEPGTDGVGASHWVADYYMSKRGIPASNKLVIDSPMACCTWSPAAFDSWSIGLAAYRADIKQPVLDWLAANDPGESIQFIVPVYGVPYSMWDVRNGMSIDSFLANVLSPSDGAWQANPYKAAAYDDLNPSFPAWRQANPQAPRTFLVSRLDGESAVMAAALVDRALEGESTPLAGTAYLDYRGVYDPACTNGNSRADCSVSNVREIAQDMGLPVVFNNNGNQPSNMIRDAPNAALAWGWYSGPTHWEGYEFSPGAVGAQLTSYTASRIRSERNGGWVYQFLRDGITATWGATTEPFVTGYAMGDVVFAAMRAGLTFGEAAYQATPSLNWAMVFIGDPLYRLASSDGCPPTPDCPCECPPDPPDPPSGIVHKADFSGLSKLNATASRNYSPDGDQQFPDWMWQRVAVTATEDRTIVRLKVEGINANPDQSLGCLIGVEGVGTDLRVSPIGDSTEEAVGSVLVPAGQRYYLWCRNNAPLGGGVAGPGKVEIEYTTDEPTAGLIQEYARSREETRRMWGRP